MPRPARLDTLQKVLTATFLAAGPVLGAAIALAWLIGLALGLFALLRH